jgi:predicted transposase YdaD
VRKALAMQPQIEKFFSDAHRRFYNRGKAEGVAKGKAEGKAEVLLMVLRRRDLAVTAEQRRRIVKCTDLGTLDDWLDRVFSVTSVKQLLA